MCRLFLTTGHGDTTTDLCLQTGGSSTGCPSRVSHASRPPSSPSPLRHHRQPLTIFYDGRVCVCHVTEDQARAIIAAARRGKIVETAAVGETAAEAESKDGQRQVRLLPHRLVQLPLPRQINVGLSTRRSLQRFLHNRRARTAVAVAVDASLYARQQRQ